jgi:hypothetical protein
VTERLNRFEVWSAGADEQLQGVGSDPYGTLVRTGLRVPTLTTPDLQSRYLFMLCGFKLGEGERANIVGWRQAWTLGAVYTHTNGGTTTDFYEQPVVDPFFCLPDGNVSWHLTQVGPVTLNKYRIGPGPLDNGAQNFKYRFAHTPALIYESAALTGSGFYADLTRYVPPRNGRPLGKPLLHLGTFHDARTFWQTSQAWNSLRLPVEGPGFFALWASVRQSAGVTLNASYVSPLNPGGLPGEYQFVLNFPGLVKIWRVVGALDVEILPCTKGRPAG